MAAGFTAGQAHEQSHLERNRVTTVDPAVNAVGAPPGTAISIEITSPLDPSTVDSSRMRVFGRWSGPASGGITLENGNTRIRFVPEEPFFAGENVTVTLSDSIRFEDGRVLEGGFAWHFWTESRPAGLELREIARVSIRRPGESRIQSYGAYAGDLNDDGWSDLVIPNEQSGDLRIFINNLGSFDDFNIVPLPFSSVPSTNEGADFNRDGFVDVAVGSGGNENVHLALGNGTGALAVGNPLKTEGNVRGLCVIDIDADGDDDIVTASRTSSSLYLLVNNGDGIFGNRIPLDGHGDAETSCAVGDANGDGIMDLFVGSLESRHVALLLGNGRGALVLSGRVVVEGRPWMLAAGDVNLDGFADVVAAGADGNAVAVILSDGRGLLGEPIAYASGLFPLAIDLGDLDGDGDLDMVSSNFQSADFTLFENTGDGTFRRLSSRPAAGAGSCAILHDRDNDGDLDLTAVDEVDDLLILFETDALPTGLDGDPAATLASLQAWPNPFSGVVSFSVDLRPGAVAELVVHDVLGRRVATVFRGPVRRSHEIRWNPSSLPAGLYFAALRSEGRTVTASLVLQR